MPAKQNIDDRKSIPTVVDGVYVSTSASQVKAFESCARYWYNRSILKIKLPQTPAQAFGSSVHSANEDYLKTGKLPEDPRLKLFVEAAIPFLPQPGVGLVEQEISLETWTDGPVWRGYVDLAMLNHTPYPRVLDHKTTSNFKYALTPHEMRQDTQMASYALWAHEQSKADTVEVAHLYLLTKNKKPKAKEPDWIGITYDEAQEVFQSKIENVRKMAELVRALVPRSGPIVDRSEEITPNLNSCNMYGGCPFRTKCGIGKSVLIGLRKGIEKNEVKHMGMSLSEKLKLKASTPSPPVEVSITPVTALPETTVNINIIPPDAPKEEPPPISLQEKLDAAPKRTRSSKKEKEVILDETRTQVFKAEDFVRKDPLSSILNRKDLILYIDCLPLKGEDVGKGVMFEDFIAPIAQQVAEQNGLPDYRMIQYTAKAALAVAIRNSLNVVPRVLIISSYSAGVSEALETLIPHATKIVKALR